MHSARWDTKYDLTDKTVAVVGGGSSAVQIIPAIQPKVKKLVPFLRSPVWITAGFGAKYAAPGGVNFQCKFYSQIASMQVSTAPADDFEKILEKRKRISTRILSYSINIVVTWKAS